LTGQRDYEQSIRFSLTRPVDNRIVIDWDGTLVEEKWPGMGDWLPGAKEAVATFLEFGYEVVIFSTRLAYVDIDEVTPVDTQQAAKVRDMLNEAGLHEVRIWTEPWKPRAFIYIDDRGMRFEGDWENIIEQVEYLTKEKV
jgi:hypothetical protein